MPTGYRHIWEKLFLKDVLSSLINKLKFELIREIFYSFLASLTGKNSRLTPPQVIVDQLTEPRPLPMGRAEFEAWSTRIISGTLLSADVDSQKFALCNMLLHLGPTESHKPDAFFVHSLRKFAINQVADDMRKELHERVKARTAAEETAKVQA